MLCLFDFVCPLGHRWEVESVNSFDADPVLNPCPTCSAQGESRIPAQQFDTADFKDELPPPPSRLENPTASDSGKTL